MPNSSAGHNRASANLFLRAAVHGRVLELPVELRAAFLAAVRQFASDLDGGGTPRLALRVKRVQGHRGVWEMSWAADGRPTFEYGEEVVPGPTHIIWRRIGTHDIFRKP